MRVVADTNTIISGLLWRSAPRHVLDAARAGQISLFTSVVLLVELEDVLRRGKFIQRLALAESEPHTLVLGYAALATIVEPAAIEPVILVDADDDAVLACAIAAHADVIVSGDRHLLELHAYEAISIITATALIAQIKEQTND